MSFSQVLQDYLHQVGCSPKELAAQAGVSPSTLSRYLSGERTPSAGSGVETQLAQALARLSNGMLGQDEIERELRRELDGGDIDVAVLVANLETLMSTLEINNNRLARALGFDPSYISRIRAGQRRPGNMALFIDEVSRYVATNCTSEAQIAKVAELCGCSTQDAMDQRRCERVIREYLGSDAAAKENPSPIRASLERFLEALDKFDLDNFLESIHFNDIKVPTAPFQLPTRKIYSGIEEMKQAELDFLKAAVLARSTEKVVFYSDMPLEEMAADNDFTRKVMMGVAMLVRKGITIQNIHDVHRPPDELFMGLEGWIPVYMTGHMESYYLPFPTNNAFLHFLRSAGTVAVAGEAIAGDQGSGRYVLSKHADDVAYYQTRARQLLALALPLVRVFREEHAEQRDAAIHKIQATYGASTVSVGAGAFSTLDIHALPGRYVLISKVSSPRVDLLVEHPALVAALEQFEPRLY